MKERIAIPLSRGVLSSHFGQCEMFAYYEVEDNKITVKSTIVPPVHEPGAYPLLLKQKKCSTIITGGMGLKAQNMFDQYGIKVIVGAGIKPADVLINEYLQGTLENGQNLCDH